MTGLNLAINARFLTRPCTGVERVAQEVLRGFVAELPADAEVVLLAPACPDTDQRNAALATADALGLPVRFGRTTGYIWEQLELPLMARGQVLWSPCNLGPILKRRHVVTIHDAQIWDVPESFARSFRMIYRVLIPLLGRSAAHVATVSHFAGSRLAAKGVAQNAVVIHNAADHMDRLVPQPPATKGPYVLALGSAAPHKNIAMVARIFEARPDFPPLFVAGGSSDGLSQAKITASDQVQFLGRVSDEALAGLMANAAGFVFPSLTEGFGIPPLEAMWMGCPVVASTGGALPEVCGDAALLVDPHDPKAWEDAIARMVFDPDVRADLTERGQTRAHQFSWRQAGAAYVKLFQKVAA